MLVRGRLAISERIPDGTHAHVVDARRTLDRLCPTCTPRDQVVDVLN